MNTNEADPPRIDADIHPENETDGTAAGEPTTGVDMTDAAQDEAVEPDDKAFEVDGPQSQAGHP